MADIFDGSENVLIYYNFKAKLRNFIAEIYSFKILSDLKRKNGYFFDVKTKKHIKVNRKRVLDLLKYNFDKNNPLYYDALADGQRLIRREFAGYLLLGEVEEDLEEDLK